MGKDGVEKNPGSWALGCVHMQILALPKLKNDLYCFSPLEFPMILPVLDKKDKAQQI